MKDDLTADSASTKPYIQELNGPILKAHWKEENGNTFFSYKAGTDFTVDRFLFITSDYANDRQLISNVGLIFNNEDANPQICPLDQGIFGAVCTNID